MKTLILSIVALSILSASDKTAVSVIEQQESNLKVIVYSRSGERADIDPIVAFHATRLLLKIVNNDDEESSDGKIYVIKKGTIKSQEFSVKQFSGSRISIGRVASGTISISVDEVSIRNKDGSYEQVILAEKIAKIEVK